MRGVSTHSVITIALFTCRVEKGVEMSVYITEFAVTRILGNHVGLRGCVAPLQTTDP